MSQGSAPIRALVQHELRLLLRDGRFWWIGAIVIGLLLSSGIFAWSHANTLHEERSQAQEIASEQWASQGDKNPHAAAHYGTWVFKPTGPLSFIDPGVESSLGVTLKLQAHKRSTLAGASTQDSTAIKHFGGLSPAQILQLILPLLIIGLGFTIWSAERERGTLRQIMSYGVPPGRLLWGKLLGLSVALALLMLPAAVIGAVGVALAPGSEGVPLERSALLAAAYVLYFGIYLFAALWVSATARSSRGALVVLLGLWGLTSLIIPRLTGDVIDASVPMPSSAEFAADIEESMENGLPGGSGREARVEEHLDQILAREGFDGGLMMMEGSLLQGFELEAEAAFEREVIDYHFARLTLRSEAQDRTMQSVALASPFVAIRAISMSLAGTDLAHHQRFSEHAESYRRSLVDQLNRELAEKGGDDAWQYTAGRELWEKAPAFSYIPPEVGWALERQGLALLGLGLWLLVMATGAFMAVRRLKVAV